MSVLIAVFTVAKVLLVISVLPLLGLCHRWLQERAQIRRFEHEMAVEALKATDVERIMQDKRHALAVYDALGQRLFPLEAVEGACEIILSSDGLFDHVSVAPRIADDRAFRTENVGSEHLEYRD